MTLIARLSLIQKAHGWDDQEMADRLGMSVRMWQMTREGRTRFGLKTLGAVLRGFPEVGPQVLTYLGLPEPKEPAAA